MAADHTPSPVIDQTKPQRRFGEIWDANQTHSASELEQSGSLDQSQQAENPTDPLDGSGSPWKGLTKGR